MLIRIGNWLIGSALVVAVLGAVIFGAVDAESANDVFWGDMARYGLRQIHINGVFRVTGIATGVAAAAAFALSIAYRLRFRREISKRAVPIRRVGVAKSQTLRRRAEAAIRPELTRANPRLAYVIDSLFGVLVDLGGTELRLDPTENGAAILLRIGIDGMPVCDMPRGVYQQVIEQLRLMIAADDADRAPRGEIRFRSGCHENMIAVVLEPVGGDEQPDICVRLLSNNRRNRALRLARLGLPKALQQQLGRALSGDPKGLILLSGATGQGVTTTLYAIGHQLARHCHPHLIACVEPDVREELPFMFQAEIGDECPAEVIRSVLKAKRQAVLLRSVTDSAAVGVALDAAKTRLVVASVDTIGAKEAIIRAATLVGDIDRVVDVFKLSIAQQLLPRLCPRCREKREPSAEERSILARFGTDADVVLHESLGCTACNETGRSGQQPVFWSVSNDPTLLASIRESIDATKEGLPVSDRHARLEAVVQLARDGQVSGQWVLTCARQDAEL